MFRRYLQTQNWGSGRALGPAHHLLLPALQAWIPAGRLPSGQMRGSSSWEDTPPTHRAPGASAGPRRGGPTGADRLRWALGVKHSERWVHSSRRPPIPQSPGWASGTQHILPAGRLAARAGRGGSPAPCGLAPSRPGYVSPPWWAEVFFLLQVGKPGSVHPSSRSLCQAVGTPPPNSKRQTDTSWCLSAGAEDRERQTPPRLWGQRALQGAPGCG